MTKLVQNMSSLRFDAPGWVPDKLKAPDIKENKTKLKDEKEKFTPLVNLINSC